jgi:uncharacterized membrane protein YgcG
MHGLLLEKKGKVIIVKPNLITRAIVLKHVDAESLVSGQAMTSLGSQVTTQETTSIVEEEGGAQAATIFDLTSKIGKILLGQQRNLIMVIDYPENVEKIEAFVKAVDGKMASKTFKLKYLSSKDLAMEFKEEEEEEKVFILGDISELDLLKGSSGGGGGGSTAESSGSSTGGSTTGGGL